MARNAQAAPFAQQRAVGADQKGAALDSAYLFTVHVFHFDDPERLAQRFVGIGNQGKGQVLLFAEIGMRLERIARNADDLAAGIDELLVGVAEVLGFGGAARRAVLGVEVQHGAVPAQAVQADLALRAMGGEFRNRLAGSYLAHAISLLGSRATTTRRPSDIRML